MKKTTLALAILMTLGLTACSSSSDTKYVTDTAAVDAAKSEAEAAKTAAETAKAEAEAAKTEAANAKAAQADAEAAKAEADKKVTETQAALEAAQAEVEKAQTASETIKKEAEEKALALQAELDAAKDQAEAAKNETVTAKAAAEQAEKALADAQVELAKAFSALNNITADVSNPNNAELRKALSNNESAKALIQKVENTDDNTGTACQAKTCGVYVAATETAVEKGVKTGGLVYNYDKSYVGYGVLREEVYEADGKTRLTTPANSIFYYVSTPTTDKAQVTNATYTGNLSVFVGNGATQPSLAQSTFKLVVQDKVISGGIEKSAGKGNAITFENATIETNSNGVVAFNGNVAFNDNISWGISASGLSSFSGTYEGQFGGANASEVVGTFKTDDKAYLPEGSKNKIDATKTVYGAFGATTTK